MANKFRGENNAWMTQGLFMDVLMASNRPVMNLDRCIYWLEEKSNDHDTRPVFKDLYIALKDPTGVQASNLYLDGYAHFEFLMELAPWFRQAIERWNREIEAILQSEALKKVRELSEDSVSDAVRLAASKYLSNKEWKKDRASKRGRPTAKEVEGEIKRQASKDTELLADFNRMKGN